MAQRLHASRSAQAATAVLFRLACRRFHRQEPDTDKPDRLSQSPLDEEDTSCVIALAVRIFSQRFPPWISPALPSPHAAASCRAPPPPPSAWACWAAPPMPAPR